MTKYLVLCIVTMMLTACAVIKLGTDNRRAQAIYDTEKARLEQLAGVGDITWAQAATRTRDLDKSLAHRTDLDTTWKFDRDDEEYHAYCVALAERLDAKQVSFAEFDSLRIARLNAIRARAESLSLQRRAVREAGQGSTTSGASGTTCFKKREWTSGFNKNCVYSCLGSEAVQTVGSTDICPLSIER